MGKIKRITTYNRPTLELLEKFLYAQKKTAKIGHKIDFTA